VVAVQYTFAHKQYTEQQNETEYTEQNVETADKYITHCVSKVKLTNFLSYKKNC